MPPSTMELIGKKHMEKGNNTFTIQEEFAHEMKHQNQREKFISLAPMVILICLIIIFSIVAEGFFSIGNVQSILSQLATPLILSVGLTFVIIIGGIDLSGEGLGGFGGSILALMVLNDKNNMNLGLWSVLIVILACAVIGIINGTIHVKGKIPSFMVTYAMSSIMAGFAVMSYKGMPATIKYPLFSMIAGGKFLGIPYLTLLAFVIFGIAYFMQEYTRFGSYVFAIGDNERVARNTGININKIKILVFAFSGFCVGVAAVLSTIRVSRGAVDIGLNTVFPAITAVVVGGTLLTGGRGGVVNSLIGALIVTVINNGLILLGVSPYYQSAVQGIIIIFAVFLSVSKGKKIIVK